MRLRNGEVEDVKCEACKKLLSHCNFVAETLEKRKERARQGDPPLQDSDATAANNLPNGDADVAAVEGSELQIVPVIPPDQQFSAIHREMTNNAEANVARDITTFFESIHPTYTRLPLGTHGKKFPVRCNVCKTKAFPSGKVLDVTSNKLYAVRHFIGQHEKCSRHQTAIHNPVGELTHGGETMACQGFILHGNGPEALHHFRAQFQKWTTFTNLEQFARHTYQQEMWFEND